MLGEYDATPALRNSILFAAFLSGAIELACERIFETHPDPLGERIADQEYAPRFRFQRHLSNGSVLEPQTVRDQPVPQFAPDIVTVEVSRKAVVVYCVGDPRRALFFLAPCEARIGEIEREKQDQTIDKNTGMNQGPPQGEIAKQSSQPLSGNRILRHSVQLTPGFVLFQLSEAHCKA